MESAALVDWRWGANGEQQFLLEMLMKAAAGAPPLNKAAAN